MRSSGLPRRASNPKTAHPHLPCPQAPLQSLTTAVSLSTPVPALPSADPFGSAPSRGCERLPATRWPDAGEPTKDRCRPEGRNLSLQRPFDPDGGDLRRSCTSRVSMGGGRGTNPKVRTGPPRAKALGRNREKSLPSPLESEWQATVDHEGTRGAEFVRDNTQDHDWPSCATSESSDPTFRRKTDRRIATSPSDLTPMRESDTPSLYPFAHHRPLPIVDPQQAARSAVNTRVIASDPASTRQLRFREPSRRFHPTTRRTRLGAQQKIRCFERSRHGHIVWSV